MLNHTKYGILLWYLKIGALDQKEPERLIGEVKKKTNYKMTWIYFKTISLYYVKNWWSRYLYNVFKSSVARRTHSFDSGFTFRCRQKMNIQTVKVL